MTKQIIVYTLDEQGKNITLKQLQTVLNHWKEYNKYRLILEVMSFVGLRAKDILGDWNKNKTQWVGGIRIPNISEDFKTIKYIVSKPHNNRERVKFKIKTRSVPDWLAIKLKLYFQNNKYTCKHNLLFGELRPKSFRTKRR